MSDELSLTEADALKAYEVVIEKGFQTFIEVGNALLAIRSQRLYRRDFITFQDYCQQRWSMSGSHAHRLIDAAITVANLNSPIGETPTHESQVRPLAKLAPEQQREVWKAATKDTPNPTAADVVKTMQVLAKVLVKEPEPPIHVRVLVKEPPKTQPIHAWVLVEPTLDELIQKARGNDCGGIWIKFHGVIVAVAASAEAQEELFSSAHNWPLAYSDEPPEAEHE